MFGNLTSRVTTTTLIVLATAIALTGILNFYKFDKTLSELLRSRYEFVLRDLQNSLETAMILGLPLADLDTVDDLLRDRAGRDAQITSIEVFDDDGVVRFSTDSSFIGDLAAESWLDASRRTGLIWSTEEVDGNTVGIRLTDSLGQPVGAIALRYSRGPYEAALNAMGQRLTLVGFWVLVSFGLIGGLAVYWLIRPIRARLAAMEAGTGAVLAGRPAADTSVEFAQSAHSARAALAEIDQTGEAIRKLDREA